ncbi:MAG: serine hydrolase [Nitrospirae bacterium]|nr:serine hydrolase [Nitrospirota bacterium]
MIERHLGESADKEMQATGYEIRQSGFKFTNPLLECEIARDVIADKELRPFKHKVLSLVDQLKASHKVSFLSVYFRDLNNGPWFGIDERELFTPASLLKVPIMISFLKLAETNPKLMEKTLLYEGGIDENAFEYFEPSKAIEPGKAYTTDELIYHMIVYSDNNAKNLLADNLNPIVHAGVFRDIGVSIPPDRQAENFMSVKSYASFFRVLFNSSYLSREMSEKALQYLSESDFRSGIVAGVPSEIWVAHKFGEHAFEKTKQLHDCGIIYCPNSPYLLCVMTRGETFDNLADAIRDVSSLVYKEVDAQNRGVSSQIK